MSNRPAGSIQLRPLPRLFRQSLLAVVAFLVPVIAVLFFVTIPDGPWPLVLALLGVILLLFALASVLFFRTGFAVSPDLIVERGFFGTITETPRDKIASAMLAHTFHGGGADTKPQLFLTDADGNQIVRMRGQFWSIDDMHAVAETLDLPITELVPAVSKAELLREYPGLLYWFERKRVLSAAIVAAAIFAGAAIVVFALVVTGIV